MDSELRQTAGRLFWVGIPGATLDASTRRCLEQLHVGGIVLFRRNVEDVDQLRRLTTAIHALPSAPLIAIDHEGGRVQRLGPPFTQFPPAAAVGRSRDPMLAHAVGRAMALELRSAGIDVNFAPVLDVHSNPANTVIGDRAFGTGASTVSAFAVAALRGLEAGGVIPCGKHFPGHGDTRADSHVERPTAERSRQQLDAVELVPFRAAIAAGVPLMMTAHVVYPALDPQHPATLSRAILTKLLRDELGFAGALISDDLEMRAIAAEEDIGGAAVASCVAGVDILLACEQLDNAARAITAVEAAMRAGQISPERLRAATARVAALERRRPAGPPPSCALPNPDHQGLANRVARIAS